jgi:hypothetical protein
LPRPGRSRCGVRSAWAPTLGRVRPCGFHCACPAAGFSAGGGRPGGSFVAGVSWRLAYRARSSDDSRDLTARLWGRAATSVGFSVSPFAVCVRSRVGVSRRRARAHLPFRRRPPRGFLAGVAGQGDSWDDGRGSWGLAPRSGCSVRLAGPAIAFARRAAPVSRPKLPWVFGSSFGCSPPVRGRHFWRRFRPWAFRVTEAAVLQDGRPGRLACPSAFGGSRRLVGPARRSRLPDRGSPCEVFAPAAKVEPVRVVLQGRSPG